MKIVIAPRPKIVMTGDIVMSDTNVIAFPKAQAKGQKINLAPDYRMMNKAAKRGEIWLYGFIGATWWGDGISAKKFSEDLKALGAVDTIDLHINSEGGSVFDARAIYTLLQKHGAKIIVHIDGFAASAASFIAMAGDEIFIAEGGFVMIHNARGGCWGEEADMIRTAALLRENNTAIRETYAARTGNSDAKLKEWMDAETWFNGKDAVKNRFADRIVENKTAAAASIYVEDFKNLPDDVLAPRRSLAAAALDRMRQLTAASG